VPDAIADEGHLPVVVGLAVTGAVADGYRTVRSGRGGGARVMSGHANPRRMRSRRTVLAGVGSLAATAVGGCVGAPGTGVDTRDREWVLDWPPSPARRVDSRYSFAMKDLGRLEAHTTTWPLARDTVSGYQDWTVFEMTGLAGTGVQILELDGVRVVPLPAPDRVRRQAAEDAAAVTRYRDATVYEWRDRQVPTVAVAADVLVVGGRRPGYPAVRALIDRFETPGRPVVAANPGLPLVVAALPATPFARWTLFGSPRRSERPLRDRLVAAGVARRPGDDGIVTTQVLAYAGAATAVVTEADVRAAYADRPDIEVRSWSFLADNGVRVDYVAR